MNLYAQPGFDVDQNFSASAMSMGGGPKMAAGFHPQLL